MNTISSAKSLSLFINHLFTTNFYLDSTTHLFQSNKIEKKLSINFDFTFLCFFDEKQDILATKNALDKNYFSRHFRKIN
jgi:hypothetical protein